MNTAAKYIAVILIILLTMSACSEESDRHNLDHLTPSFTTAITRVTDNMWDRGDQVGISMMQGSQILRDKNNFCYNARPDGSLSPCRSAITYPEDNTSVDIIAYYPYTDSSRNGLYTIDLANQGRLSSIDFLYSSNARDKQTRDKQIQLAFSHKLTLVTLNLDNNSEENVSIRLYTETKGEINLATGQIKNNGGYKLVTNFDGQRAIVMPGSRSKVEVVCGGTRKSLDIPTDMLETGKKFNLNVIINKNATDTTITFGNATINDWGQGRDYDFEIEVGKEGGDTPVVVPGDFYVSPTMIDAQPTGVQL